MFICSEMICFSLRFVKLLFLQERNTEHFQKFIQCQKYTNDARNLEQSVAMVKGNIDKRLQKLLSQKAKELKIAR